MSIFLGLVLGLSILVNVQVYLQDKSPTVIESLTVQNEAPQAQLNPCVYDSEPSY